MGMHQIRTVADVIRWTTSSPHPSRQQGFRTFIPDIGWVLAVVLFFSLILRDAIRDFLKKFIDAMISSLIKRFAGSRIFRARAIRLYRDTISAKLANMPVPFKLPMKISMKDVYIPLRAATHNKPVAGVTMELGQTIMEKQRALVLGAPGSGKSLFLRYLAWSACSRADEPDSSIPVIVPLTRLAARDDSIMSEIVKTFHDNGFPRAAEFISRDLERKVPRLLILFDGLDEVGSRNRLRVSNQIVQFAKTYPGARFIVTCRTAAYSGSLDGSVDEVFYVQDLSDELVDRFLYAWPALNARGAVDRLINALRDTPRVAILVHNPLLLTMLAYLYSYEYKGSSSMLPRNRTQFYRDATELLLRRWQEEFNKFPWMAKKVALQHLALVNERQGANRREINYENILSEIREVLPRVNIESDQADEILSEIYERSGILTSLDNGERYQFAHMTLQEYFAASELIDKPETLVEEYRRDPEAWREPLKLWCGGESDSTAVIRSVMEIDEVLALECLADATRVEESLAFQIIERMKPALENAGSDDPVVRAFGLLASDRRPRGREVFDFLVRHAREATPRPSYAAALVATNLKDAADVLAELAGNNRSLMPLLVQMGNLAVPGLSLRAQAGNRDFLTSLTAIGTPRAAEALVAVLSNPSPDVAKAAAIELMQLSASRTIEDALSQLTLPPTFPTSRSSALNWAWQPFTINRPESERQTLQLIFGRVIELLESFSSGDLANVSRPLDARLATFLFSFRINGEPRKVNTQLLSDVILKTIPDAEFQSKPSSNPIFSSRIANIRLLAPILEAVNSEDPGQSLRARDTIFAALEEQAGMSHCQLLRLAEPRTTAALLRSLLETYPWEPTRREWLAMGEKKIFKAEGSAFHHRLPIVLICFAAALSAIYIMLAGWHASGWTEYLDFAAAAGGILGVACIMTRPWNTYSVVLDVWDDAGSAIVATLLSPLAGFFEIWWHDDFASSTSGLATVLFTPAWVYSLFRLLSHEFGIASAISAEIAFIAVAIALFTVGQMKDSRSRTPFRAVFARVDVAASESLIS